MGSHPRKHGNVAERPVGVRLDARGRIVVPAAHRQALGLDVGDTLLLSRQGEEVRLVPRSAMVGQIQQELAKRVPTGGSLVDELIAERRREGRCDSEDDG